MCRERLDKRMDKRTARHTTVSQLISSLPSAAQQEEWQAAFGDFARAWELSWHRVEAFGCQVRFLHLRTHPPLNRA